MTDSNTTSLFLEFSRSKLLEQLLVTAALLRRVADRRTSLGGGLLPRRQRSGNQAVVSQRTGDCQLDLADVPSMSNMQVCQGMRTASDGPSSYYLQSTHAYVP
jgi:hypothetical protein